MPSNFDDVVRKNKQYLTQAQVNALAAAAKEYNIQNAGNRAGALASVREQYGTGYRGLQNMGLAGNISGADTSGEVPRLRQKIAEPFGAYNRSLQDVENKRLSALGGQMAQQTRAARAAEAAARAAALAAAQANLGNAMRIGTVAAGMTGAAGAAQNAANKYQIDGMKRTAQVNNDAELSAQIASKQVPGVSAEDLAADKKKKAAYSAAVAAQYRGMKQTADVIYQQNQQKVNTYLDAQYRGLKQTAAAQAQIERENIANRAAAEILGVRTPTAYERAEQTRLQREAAASRNEQAARNGQTIGERIGEAHLNRQLLSDDPRGIQRTEAEEALRVFNTGLKTGYNDAEDKQALEAAQKKVDALASVRGTSARPGAEEAYQQAVRQRDIAKLKVEDPQLYAFMVVSSSDLPAETKHAAGEKFMERFDDDRQEAGRLYTEASQKYDAAVRQWKGETSTTQEQSVTDVLAMYDDAVKSKSQTRIDAAEQQLRKLGYTSAEAARKAVEEQAQKEQQDAEKYEEVSQIVAELKAATTEYENATKYSEDPYAATGANRKIQELGQVLMNYYDFKEPEEAEAWLAKYEEQHKEPADVDEDEQYRYYKRLLDIVDTDYKDRTPVEKGLLADAEDFDEDEARKFVADYESEKSQAQQAAPDYVTQAQQEYAMAELRYKNPDTYRALRVYQFRDMLQDTNPEVVEWAEGKVADYEYGQMGFKVPKMTDEEYAEAKEKAPEIQEILDRIDSARIAQEQKKQTNTTGSVDYWQRDIDELVAELKSEYGMTEDEARSMVERYRADKDARSEKNYYYPGMLAQVQYSGMTPEKPVNNDETDDVYRYINGLSTLKMSGMGGMADSSIPEDKRVAKWMTDEQKATYNAIYEQDGIEAANKYFQDIIPYLNIQRAMQDEAFYKQLADEHPIVADIASVGANMLWNIPAALDRLVHGAMNIGQDEQKYYDTMGELSYRAPRADIIRSERSLNIVNNAARPEWLNDTLNFAYQTGMSMADSATAMAFAYAGAPWMVDAMFFSSAGNSAYREARAKGATQDQAMAISILSGTAEALFEHASIEHFMKMDYKGKNALIKNLFSQAVAEGSEEVTTEITNALSDAWVMMDKSEYNQSVKEYVSQGMTEEQAQKKAFLDQLYNIGMAGFGGAVSGALFGLGGALVSNVSYKKAGKSLRSSSSQMQQYTNLAHLLGGEPMEYLEQYTAEQTDTNAGKLKASVDQQLNEAFGGKEAPAVSKVDAMNQETAAPRVSKPGNQMDLDAAVREQVVDKATAYSALLSGDKMNAATAQTVMDVLGAEPLQKMGYDTSSPMKLMSSYNKRLTQYGIKSRSEALSSIRQQTGIRDNYRSAGMPSQQKASSMGMVRTGSALTQTQQRATEANVTRAENNATNRVWANPTQGLAQTVNGRTVTPMPGNLTAVSFAEQQRNNFKANATATTGKVTYAVAGMQAREGMSNEQTLSEIKKGLTKEARAKANFYEKLSKALGLKMTIHDVMVGTNGFIDENGNMHVVLSGKQSVLRVAAHELTHYMKENAAGHYAELRKHLIADVGQDTFDRMVKQKAREYGIDLSTEKGKTIADDEVCAELCERMLSNEDAIERFAEKNTSAAKTLKDHLLKILNAIKSALKDAKNRDFGESWSDMVTDQETIEKWITGIDAAIQNAEKNEQTAQATKSVSEQPAQPTESVTSAVVEKSTKAEVDEKMLDELFMGENDLRDEQAKKAAEESAKKKTYVRGFTSAEVERVLKAGVLGNKSNYEGGDYEQARGMIAQLIPEIVSAFKGEADLTDVNDKINTAVKTMLENYFEDNGGNMDRLRETIPDLIGVDKTAKGDLKYQDTNLFKMSAELSHALGKRVTLISEKNAKGQKNYKYQISEKLDTLWDRIREEYNLDDEWDFSIDTTRLLDFIEREANNRKTAKELFGSSFQDEVAAITSEIVDAVADMYSEKTGERYSLDTDALRSGTRYDLDTDELREAFTHIDTSALDNGLEALKNVTPGTGVWALKDISRFLDSVAGGNKELRDNLTKIFETPHRKALKNYATGVGEMQQKVLDIGAKAGVCDAKGRHFDKKKSAAIQNIGEGFSNRHTDVTVRMVDADAVRVAATDKETGKSLGTKDYTFRELRGAYGREVADQLWSEAFDAAQEAGKPVDVEREVNTQPYTLEDLKAAYPQDWQKLKTAADEFRTMYDNYIRDINNMLETIYPNASKYATVDKMNEAIEKKQQRLADRKAAYKTQIENLKQSLEEKEKEIASKKRTDTKAFRQLVDQANQIRSKIADTQAEIAEYEANVKDELTVMGEEKALMQNAEREGDSLSRMHRLEYRSDYFHHFTEMTSGVQNLKSIFTGNTDISPAVVGKSDQTKPKTRFGGFFQKRRGGDYTADALNGMLRYGQLAEYKLAFDPLAAYLRNVEKQVTNLDKNATNRDNLIRYIQQWTNNILGKSHTIDRALVDSGIGMRSKLYKALNWINSRVIQNTLLWNMRSALIQISNVTNAKGIVTNNLDWANGLRKWALAARGNSEMQAIMNQSTFLASRYMDNLQLTDSVFKSAKEFAGWLLGALDEVSAKATWWAAYTQYQRNPNAKVIQNASRTYDNAIDYADDVTRRTHAGRGVGELAPAMTSRVINLIAPFQVEVNNTYQLLKDNVKQKNYWGLLSTGLSVFALNTVFEAIVGSTPLGFDFIRAIVDIAFGIAGDDPNDDKDDYDVMTAAQRLAGEFVGGLPYVNQIVGLIGKDNAEKILGSDTDVTRYGNTQIGLNAMMNTISGISDIGSAVKNHKNLLTETNFISDIDDLLNIIMPMGAKQLTRTAEGLMTVAKGYGGKVDKEGNEKVQFVADQDLVNWLHAGLFGKWSLTQASEYFKEERLLPKLFGAYEGPKSATGTMVDAKEYKAALETGIDGKQYFSLKFDLNKHRTDGGKREELMQQDDLTAEQKADLDFLLITEHGKDTKVEDGVLYELDDDNNWKPSKKADGGILYTYKSKTDEWEVKTDYTSQDMYELSSMGAKIYTTTNGLISDGFDHDGAMTAAKVWYDLKDTPDELEGVNDGKLAFRKMLFESTAYTVKQKQALDKAFCEYKTQADYTDKELFDISVSESTSKYEKAKEAKDAGLPVEAYMSLSDKKAALKEKNKELKEKGESTEGISLALRRDIMDMDLTVEQKEALDDLVVSDTGKNPDYSDPELFELSVTDRSTYEKAMKAKAQGVSVKTYTSLSDKKKAYNGDGQAAYMRGEIMKTNLSAKQKELLDDLLVSDTGRNPDYSSQAWFDVSMLGKTQYETAKEGAKVGMKPEVYLAAYKKYQQIQAKDSDGKHVNTKAEAKKLMKEYLDGLVITAPVYDFIWYSVFKQKKK